MACHFYSPRYYDLTMKAVNGFMEQHSFVDVKLVCKNKKIVYSHKLILVSASPFLKSVIGGLNSNDMATVFLPDFDCNIVRLLLTFLYEGIMKLTWEELREFRELCNVLLLGPFPGAQVVKVSKDMYYAQSSPTDTQQASDIASRDVLHTPAEVPDTSTTNYDVASIVPKIEDCEECQSFETNQLVSGNDFQNTGQMCDVNTTQQSLTDCYFSQPEKHTQTSLQIGESVTYSDATGNAESWKKVKYSHDDTSTNLNLWHAQSSSTQELSQNNDYHFIHQKSTLPMVQNLNSIANNSHSESDMNSVTLTVSAGQSAYQQVQTQPNAKMKNLNNNNKHLLQLLNSTVQGTAGTNRSSFSQN